MMTDEKMQEYKSLLEEQRESLSKRVQALGKDKTRQGGSISADSSEQAQEIVNDEVIDHLEDIESDRLSNIELAIKRIDENEYGVCMSCGEEISESRLKALPHTAICIKCSP